MVYGGGERHLTYAAILYQGEKQTTRASKEETSLFFPGRLGKKSHNQKHWNQILKNK